MFNKKHILFASVIGNWVEWYNFLLVVYLEPIIGKLFFPHSNPLTAVMLVFLFFAVGFLARPLGSVLFGYVGDKYGRQKALVLSLVMLTVSAWMMALMPTYPTLGILSPILVGACRILFGLSAGGEHIGSAIYLSEMAPANRKALWISLAPATAAIGIMSASFAAFLLTSNMSAEKILAWGWRIPFIVGAIFALASIKLRLSLPETPVFENIHAKQLKQPEKFSHLFFNMEMLYKLLIVIALMTCWAIYYNTLYVWMPTYLSDFVQLNHNAALKINNYCMLLLTIFIVSFGYLADKIKPRNMLLVATAGLLISTYPLFLLITSGLLLKIYLAMILFTLLFSMYMASTLVIVLQSFAGETRYTGASLGFNLSLAIFGGTTPLVTTELIRISQNHLAPAYYLMLVALIALVVCYRRTS